MLLWGAPSMNNFVEVYAIVEGPTEAKFIKEVLAPYLGTKHVFISGIIASKPGQKGGDIRFDRFKNDIGRQLKQRADIYVTQFVDFYGIHEWPEYAAICELVPHTAKAEKFCSATLTAIQGHFPKHDAERRFIPYVCMHEFEALLFSDTTKLANHLGVDPEHTERIVKSCGEPERINNSSETAPSKRIKNLNARYGKTSTGITIAQAIGIEIMREQCPLFDAWLTKLENLTPLH